MSKLYVVGTPIGNLGDMSPRGVKALENADFIAAEDTRVSLKLLNYFGIKKPLVSYYEHNIRERGEQIVSRILSGESCAVITDAGMPCVSDPGEDLVRICAEHGIETVAVPGPTALITALALSGLPTGRFTFEGFLSVQKNSRAFHLQSIKDEQRTMIFYEAPHKLKATLKDMLQTLGERKIALCRELTKLYEEVERTTLSQAVAKFERDSPRGEYVLVLEGAKLKEAPIISFSDALDQLLALYSEGESLSSAAKEIARETGYKRSELYKAALDRERHTE